MKDDQRKPFQGFNRESAAELLADWRALLSRLADEAEEFTREKPKAGLLAAFCAGAFFASLFRRRW
jgi:hypothetical protein